MQIIALPCFVSDVKALAMVLRTISQSKLTLYLLALTDCYIYLCKKNCSFYIQCKSDIVVVDIKQHKSI